MTKEATVEAPKTDLSIFDTTAACDKGFELELVHPITKAPVGVFIGVVGKDSTAFKDYVRKQSNDRLRRQFQNQRRGKEAEAYTVEQIEGEAIELLVTCTTGWRNVELPGEGVVAFSPDNCRKVYTQYPAIRSQVDEAIADLENFMSA